MTNTPDTKPASEYDRIGRLILDAVAGIDGATFGYIGNAEVAYGGNWTTGPFKFDDRSWSVFLPHPGRVGTDFDRIGSFRTGDVDGARDCLRELRAFARGVAFARSNVAAAR